MRDLIHDREHLRRLVLADKSAGLDEWEVAIAEFRDAYLLDDCRRLLNAAKAWPLSEHGRARVREEEAVLAIEAGDWPRAGRLLRELLDAYRALVDRHGEARTLGHLGMLADLNGDAETAAGYLAQAGALFAFLGDPRGDLVTLVNLIQLLTKYDPESVRSLLAAARTRAETLNDSEKLAEEADLETLLTPKA